jgi:hypothetical protein
VPSFEEWLREESSPIREVELIQARLDIDAQLAQADQAQRLPELEEAFVNVGVPVSQGGWPPLSHHPARSPAGPSRHFNGKVEAIHIERRSPKHIHEQEGVHHVVAGIDVFRDL